ncbi:MAG: DUF2306 domain-containing protein [Planctomycetaceae bacterium]|jgi:hypothetical protein|nr:DUF2306 domain-containing protein [Planctomycetaceae bacterium]MBT6484483.1 DUF2306 domain-containing protein [Planctomycetaceae bacterium]MBT6498139.1 DUF2306 domain-containing protein [Planctomycetaceae bacterium]
MNTLQVVLWVHVAAGFAALTLGPVAMSVRKRRGSHTRVGEVYHWLVLVACLLAVVVVLFDWRRLYWFVPISVGSYAFAFLGYVAVKKRWHGWLEWHVIGQLGSYIAMVTAFLVNNWHTVSQFTGLRIPMIVVWLLPSIVGSPIIFWVNLRIAKRQRQS